MISVCNSRFGSQELAKGRDSGGRRAAGWAATKRWVRMTLMYVYRSYEPCRVLVCELFYIASPIIFDLEFICYCRFGSQELAKGMDSGTRAAGDEKVSQWGFDLYRRYDLLGVFVCELFLIIYPIICDLESIYYCRFGSQELAKGMDSGTRAAGDEKVSQWGFDLYRRYDLLGVFVCELFLIIYPIICDLESIYYCRFGSQELAKGMDSGARAAGDEKVSLFELHVTLIYIEVISDPWQV